MLATQDKEEIKRLVGEMIAEFSPSSSSERKYTGEVEDLDELQMFVARLRDLVVNEGFTELTFVNPATGDWKKLRRVLAKGGSVARTGSGGIRPGPSLGVRGLRPRTTLAQLRRGDARAPLRAVRTALARCVG